MESTVNTSYTDTFHKLSYYVKYLYSSRAALLSAGCVISLANSALRGRTPG